MLLNPRVNGETRVLKSTLLAWLYCWDCGLHWDMTVDRRFCSPIPQHTKLSPAHINRFGSLGSQLESELFESLAFQ